MAASIARRRGWFPAAWAYALAASIAVAFCLYLFPLDFMAGRGHYWSTLRADGEISVIGMRYFLADQWRFPLLHTRLLLTPDGVNIIYTDSVPLMALAAKSVRAVLPAGVNYFGLWYVMAYVLQSLAAVYLVRALGVRTIVPQLAAAVLAISFPALLFRTTFHPSLTAHFFLLWALGLYFAVIRDGGTVRRWAAFLAVLLTVLLVHAYLFLMVFAIFMAAVVQHMLASRRAFREGVAVLATTGVSIGAVMWLVGYFEGAGGTAGFGYYSMNLASPWVPQRSGLFPGMQSIVDATGGQHEGFNYLGAGALVLLAAALWVRRGGLPKMARQYWALVLVLASFFVLAASNRVYFGRHAIVDHIGPGLDANALDAPAPPTPVSAAAPVQASAQPPRRPAASGPAQPRSVKVRAILAVKGALNQVRSSGRFFWPIGYALAIGSLAVVATELSATVGIALCIFAVLLQLVDTGPLRDDIRVKFGKRSGAGALPKLQFPPDARWQPAAIGADPWRALIGRHRQLTILPTFECAGFVKRWDVLDLMFQASATATPVNTSYLARRPEATDCQADEQRTLARALGEHELLVVLTPPIDRASVMAMPGFEERCRAFELGFACSRAWPGETGSTLARSVPGPRGR